MSVDLYSLCVEHHTTSTSGAAVGDWFHFQHRVSYLCYTVVLAIKALFWGNGVRDRQMDRQTAASLRPTALPHFGGGTKKEITTLNYSLYAYAAQKIDIFEGAFFPANQLSWYRRRKQRCTWARFSSSSFIIPQVTATVCHIRITPPLLAGYSFHRICLFVW